LELDANSATIFDLDTGRRCRKKRQKLALKTGMNWIKKLKTGMNWIDA
jgi:hypothetical protein